MRFLFWRRREKDLLDKDLDDEIESHLRMAAGDREARGLSRREAEQLARMEFGNVALVKETTRHMWPWVGFDRFLKDLRFALRILGRSPGFTAIAVLSLALGIGANTAIFTACNVLMLRQLPVDHPDQLVTVGTQDSGDMFEQWPYPTFEKFRELTDVFSGISAIANVFRSNIDIAGQGGGLDSAQVNVALISGTYFSTLGVRPAVGRLFTSDDDRVPDGHPVAVISYNYWQRRFSRSEDVVGRTFTLNQTSYRILGVTRAGFTGDWVEMPTDIWIPIAMQSEVVLERPGLLANPNPPWVRVVARLKPGVQKAQAVAELKVAFAKAVREWQNLTPRMLDDSLKRPIMLESSAKGFSWRRGSFRQPLIILMVTVGMVLMIACVNIANLLLARSAAREKEMSVRLSLGAGRRHIFWLLLTESLMIGLTGGLLGILLASWGSSALSRFLASASLSATDAPMVLDLHPDARALAFTAALALLTGVLFGLAPAMRSARASLTPALSTRGSAGTRGAFSTGKALVIAQVALSLVLLIGAGLFVETLRNLRSQDVGFERNRILLFWTAPDQQGRQGESIARLYESVQDRLRTLPGVLSAAPSAFGLLGGSGGSPVVNVEGYTGKPDPDYFTSWSLIGPGFFDTAGMRLLLGRDFTRRDSETAPRVAIVNESFARFYFSGGNPVGKHFGMRRDTGAPIEIVGLVKDAKYQSLRDNHLKMIYIPYRQDLHHLYSMCVLVHPGADSPGIRQTVRDALRAVDPGLPILRIETAEEQVDSSLFEERLIAAISSFFGIVAVLLACLGLYGVMAYQTARRTNEIGVRMALGATRGRVLGMVLEESVWLVAGGIVCGIPLTLAATRFVSSKLFGVTPADPITIAAAAILMISVAAVAAFVPARRAAKVDPMVALRYE